VKIIIREFGDRCWFTLVYYIVTSKWIVFNLRLQAKLASFERILPEVHAYHTYDIIGMIWTMIS